jgi:hypothetical protein
MIDLTGDVCDLYLVDTTNGFNRACRDVWVIRLEADTGMIEPLATGVPLVDSPTFVTGSVVITYDQPGLIPGSNYVIDSEYQNSLSQVPCLMLFDSVESESIGSWKSSPFTIASH